MLRLPFNSALALQQPSPTLCIKRMPYFAGNTNYYPVYGQDIRIEGEHK